MTYFGFLLRFLLPPILILAALTFWGGRRSPTYANYWRAFPLWKTLALFVAVAVIYTTPWDNYLVATGVWWYDSRLVTGLTIGWVPIEEYTFFVLQTIFTGLWLILISRAVNLSSARTSSGHTLRRFAWIIPTVFWVLSTTILASGWKPATYLTLILSWGLLPVIIQLAFGADILWKRRSIVLLGILPTSLYLGLVDRLAILAGTWTIDPVQTLGMTIGGVLPLEELVFFFMTNILLVFGMVLFLDIESQARLQSLVRRADRLTGSWRLKNDPSQDPQI